MSATSTPTDGTAVAPAAPTTAAPAAASTETKAEPTTAAKQEQPQPTVADKVLGALKPDGEKQAEQPKKEGEQKPAPTAPEKYEAWKLPDGVKLSKDIDATFSDLAKRAGLSQADAQTALDKLVNGNLEQQQQEYETTVKQWADELYADPELGGDALLAKTMPNVNKALEAFDDDGSFAAWLKTGPIAKLAIARFLDRIGKAVSPTAGLVLGQLRAPEKEKTDGELFYPSLAKSLGN